MKNGKKTIIITLILIFIFITILVIYLSSKVENKPNKNNINSENNEKIFKKVDDYNEFFSIQSTLNNNDELNTTYIIQDLFLNKIGNTKYYFIKCSRFISNIGEETVDYNKNIYYLLISNNNKYILNNLDNIENLEDYARNYPVVDKIINSNQGVQKGYTSEEIILTFYLEYFKKMLLFDTKLAYEMLTDNTKKLYINYEDFYQKRIDLYSLFSSKIFGYNLKEENDKKIYYVDDNNRNKIIITENGIMDFKISY